jgi:hypothetical protein
VGDVEDGVRPVVRNLGIEAPLGLVRPFVDEAILGLRRPETVVDLLLVQPPARHPRLGKAAVENPPVMGPGPRELDEFQVIGKVLAARDVPDAELLPIRARGRDSVDEVVPVLAQGKRRERRRPFLRELVGIEKNFGRSLE